MAIRDGLRHASVVSDAIRRCNRRRASIPSYRLNRNYPVHQRNRPNRYTPVAIRSQRWGWNRDDWKRRRMTNV